MSENDRDVIVTAGDRGRGYIYVSPFDEAKKPKPCEYLAKGCLTGVYKGECTRCTEDDSKDCRLPELYKMLKDDADVAKFNRLLREYAKGVGEFEVRHALFLRTR